MKAAAGRRPPAAGRSAKATHEVGETPRAGNARSRRAGAEADEKTTDRKDPGAAAETTAARTRSRDGGEAGRKGRGRTARALWSGALSFGLVNIPVRLYSATRESRLDLDMLDRRDMARIHYKRVNERTGKEVPWPEIARGYKYEGEYVMLTDEDFDQANAKKTHTLEILSFADVAEIDPLYFEAPYYLEPERSGCRAYAVLREALKWTGRVGVATFVMRTRESLATIKPVDDVLVLYRLRFQQEIRAPDDLSVPPRNMLLRPSEVDMAERLIEEYTEPFDISGFRDTFTDELMAIIETKAQGRRPPARRLELAPTRSRDLMAQLNASLERKRQAS
jgi:DNA end-binding protein Ku